MDQRQNRQRRDYVPPEMLRRVSADCGCSYAACASKPKGEQCANCCNCREQNGAMPLAMVYPICQPWREIYDVEEGFAAGTIFRELDFPFYPTPCYGGKCAGRGGR